MSVVIGVGGRLEAGKDAFSDYLVEKHGFVKLGMSDTLAEALYRLNPYIQEGYEYYPYQDFLEYRGGYVEAKKNPEVRRLLQVLGTEVGRDLLGQDIWVKAAKRRIDEHTAAGTNVVITGVRFPNELAMFDRPDIWHTQWVDPITTTVWVERGGSTAAHSSEASVSSEDFEYVLDNLGTLEELHTSAERLYAGILADYA
jgi:hypothetical protein